MAQIVCEGCGATTASYDTVTYGSIDGGYQVLCSRCVNSDVATRAGLGKFEHVRLEPVKLADCNGVMHEFHLRTRLLGDIVSLEAFELCGGAPGGYEFQIIGDPLEDIFSLCGRLVEKISRPGSEARQTWHARAGNYRPDRPRAHRLGRYRRGPHAPCYDRRAGVLLERTRTCVDVLRGMAIQDCDR